MLTTSTAADQPAVEWPVDATLGPIMTPLEPSGVLSACLDRLPVAADDAGEKWQCARMIEALYHPGRYVRVAYALLADPSVPPARYWPQGDVVYLHYPVRSPLSRRGVVLEVGGCEFECYRFPNDRRLRGLRKFTGRGSSSSTWQAWIDGVGDPFRLDADTLRRVLIRYVPEQKWIARLRARGTESRSGKAGKRSIAVRASSPGVTALLAQRHRLLADWAKEGSLLFQLPRVVGEDSQGGLLALEWLRGKTLVETLGRDSPGTVMDRVAGALRSLHGARVPSLPLLTDSDAARRIAQLIDDLAGACPSMAPRLVGLGDEIVPRLMSLGGSVQDSPVTVHNDFHWNQMRFADQRLALFDFDRMGRGDPLIDVANFASQLRMLGRRREIGIDPATADRWAELFVESWQRTAHRSIDRDRFACYAVLSVLDLACGMMRHLRPGWHELASHCVEYAHECLSSTKESAGLP